MDSIDVSRDPFVTPAYDDGELYTRPWQIHEIASDSDPAADGGDDPHLFWQSPCWPSWSSSSPAVTVAGHHKANGCRTQHHGGPPHPAGHPRRHQTMPGTHPNGAARLESEPRGASTTATPSCVDFPRFSGVVLLESVLPNP